MCFDKQKLCRAFLRTQFFCRIEYFVSDTTKTLREDAQLAEKKVA